MSVRSIESLLLVSSKPVAIKRIGKILGVSEKEMEQSVTTLQERYNQPESGIHVLVHEGKIEFVTHGEEADLIKTFLKQEVTGELSRPSLETLTIIAYKGPITKPEIEQIRGINCSMILRNLLMRGLVEEKEDKQRLQPVFTVSVNFLRHLGLDSIKDLPNYQELNEEEITQELMDSVPVNEE